MHAKNFVPPFEGVVNFSGNRGKTTKARNSPSGLAEE